MTEDAKILQALEEGNVELLEGANCDEAALADESIQVACRFSSNELPSYDSKGSRVGRSL
jgi:hypothetical protein